MDTEVSPKLFIGIDVHKHQWSVSIFTANCHHKTFSQTPDPKE
ncbi:hypothetical protein [Algoriphagus formosus]|nr:hypothetical protein [Algoriphagus formosus]